LGTSIVRALWAWGTEHGATRSYLQVEYDDVPAVALHESLGYREHHGYRYRRDPLTPDA
jgi:hypothetical protein